MAFLGPSEFAPPPSQIALVSTAIDEDLASADWDNVVQLQVETDQTAAWVLYVHRRRLRLTSRIFKAIIKFMAGHEPRRYPYLWTGLVSSGLHLALMEIVSGIDAFPDGRPNNVVSAGPLFGTIQDAKSRN